MEGLEPTKKDSSAPLTRLVAGGQCAYCGSALDARFYFCTRCAMPYQEVETVLPAAKPLLETDGMLIARKAPQAALLFWIYFSVVIGAGILAHLAFRGERPDLVLLFQMPPLFITTCIFAALYWRSLAVQFKRLELINGWTMLGILALAPLLGLSYVYHRDLSDFDHVARALDLEELLGGGMSRGALILILCVFPAVVEEIAFRGLLQHWLQAAITPLRAVVLASALFTVLHFTVLSAPFIFAIGMILGWVKLKTRSLYPCMLIHFLHNLIVIEFFPY